MPALAIDPILVTTPGIGDRAGAVARLTALAAWLAEVEESPFEWRHFLECSNALAASGKFLSFTEIRKLANTYRLPVDAARINRAISRFFQDPARSLRANLKIQDVLVADPPGVRITPEQIVERNAAVRAEFELALACLAVHLSLDATDRVALVTEVLDPEERECHVAVRVEMTEPTVPPEGERLAEVVLPLVFAPNDMVGWVGATTIFNAGEDTFRTCIAKMAGARARGRVVVGTEFMRSLVDRGAIADTTCLEKILRVSAALAAGGGAELGRHAHVVRESDSPNSKQRTRSDGASAWRIVLSKHGAGWRMHLWHYAEHGGGEVFELVRVLAEQDPVVM